MNNTELPDISNELGAIKAYETACEETAILDNTPVMAVTTSHFEALERSYSTAIKSILGKYAGVPPEQCDHPFSYETRKKGNYVCACCDTKVER